MSPGCWVSHATHVASESGLVFRGHDSSKGHGLTLLDPARPFPPYSPLELLLNAQFQKGAPGQGLRGPRQALGRNASSGQDFLTWFHPAEAARAGSPRGACNTLTYHTLQCAAQHRHQDRCPGVSWVHLCPGGWLGDRAILSSVGKHQSQGLAAPRLVGRWLPCVPENKRDVL